ncbi:hypothetical protein GH714_042114 [Hevea brasiliensis]|uniref:Homeobox domain-containing protein n=1 Tax=Hevea brasiliensis TaxID=3981 RepID=A0A6A6MX71_HEVBR|nr:hypothetical protein GH714_042114 [Hevea brasiliensis]
MAVVLSLLLGHCRCHQVEHFRNHSYEEIVFACLGFSSDRRVSEDISSTTHRDSFGDDTSSSMKFKAIVNSLHSSSQRQKEALAMQLRLRPRQVEVWFQNRRARSKLKQTEMECEYLKRWFGSLTEQNRRLQREVEELRAMKVGPPTVISPHSCEPLPASTLTMCPRCERVTTTTSLDKGPTKTTATASTVATATAATLSSKVGTPPCNLVNLPQLVSLCSSQ